MSYSQADLDAAWAAYVGLKQADWIAISNPSSPVYNADLAARVGYIFQQRLYGFALNPTSAAGSNQFPGNGAITTGPTKS